jgi:hypothetical protein
VRLPADAHTTRPWRIHAIAPDFRLEDVWALPTPGGPEDFPRLVELFRALDPLKDSSGPVRALFAIRLKLGELLGWDSPDQGRESSARSLLVRLPDDLRGTRPDGGFLEQYAEAHNITQLYLTDDEWAVEIANRTVHGVLHLGWVHDEEGGYRGQMAVLVKRNGLLGSAYMTAIAPFRHLIVYPALMHDIARRWHTIAVTPAPTLR